MNKDIRLLISFKGHHKRKRLKRKIGEGYLDYLIDLWLSVGENRPDGILSGWTNEDIADYAGWEDDPNVFVMALRESGFLDIHQRSGEELILRCHDWYEHQPWAVGAEERSKAARVASLSRKYPLETAREMVYGSAEASTNTALDRNDSGPTSDRSSDGHQSDHPPSSPFLSSPKEKESKPKKKSGEKKFKKPTLQQVKDYCKERGSVVDPDKWMAHYESNGWKVGKNPMKDWKGAVRTWEPDGHAASLKVLASKKFSHTIPDGLTCGDCRLFGNCGTINGSHVCVLKKMSFEERPDRYGVIR